MRKFLGEKNPSHLNMISLIGKKIIFCNDYGVLTFETGEVLESESEGSWSDWWEDYFKVRKKYLYDIIKDIYVYESSDKIIITFVNNNNKEMCKFTHIFHNDSDWNYGCYVRYKWGNSWSDADTTDTFYT